MRYQHIISRLFNTPLMLLPSHAEVLASVVLSRVEGVPLEIKHEGSYKRRDMASEPGVAVIDISGALVNKSGWMDAASGIQSYADIRESFRAAMQDSGVSGIVLTINSPGGEVSGAFDLADFIFEARGQKPIYAIVDELAASAGYLIASAADEIAIPRTGTVGSIGVITKHVDVSKAVEAEGVVVTTIMAGDKKDMGSPYRPITEAEVSEISTQINTIYDLFVSTVARNRSMSPEAVRSTQAGLYSGQEAVAVGFADVVMSADSAMLEITRSNTMTLKATQTASLNPTAAAVESIPVDLEAVRIEATKAEQGRIAKILSLTSAKANLETAMELCASGVSAEVAEKILATIKVPEVQASTAANEFAAEMARVQNPKVDSVQVEQDAEAALVSGILAFSRKRA